MGWEQYLTFLVVAAGGGAYYWFKVLRHGGHSQYMQKLYGQRDGEQLKLQFNAQYDFDQSTAGAVAGALVGVRKRGRGVLVALSDQGRLLIGHLENSDPPWTFEKGQVDIQPYAGKPKVSRMHGTAGMEPAKVVELKPTMGQPFRIAIAQSGAEHMLAWAASAPVGHTAQLAT